MQIIHISETDSTSNMARKLADGEMKGVDTFAVRADFQTAGRGQIGNHWESANGENLLLSVCIHPQGFDVANQFLMSMSVSLATLDAVRPLLPENKKADLKIKWPNDIYVGLSKLAGILIENRLAGHNIADTIIGIGLNVNQTQFLSDAPNPISISQLTGKKHDVAALCDAFLAALRFRLTALKEGNYADIQREYMTRLLWADGEMHSFADARGTFLARISGVAADGHFCLIDQKGEAHEYLFKEVEHVISEK